MLRIGLVSVATVVAAAAGPAPARDAPSRAPLAAARVEERLGAALPRELFFHDPAGRPLRLGDALGEGPAILVLGYYSCPMLCGRILDAAADALARLEAEAPDLRPRVVAVSVDPGDGPARARQRQQRVLEPLGWSARRWPFLVGDAPAIARLTEAVGFGYRYDRASGQFAHPAVLVVLTPEGRVSSYVYGLRFDPRELAEALRAARAGGTREALHPVLLRCLQYVPALRRWSQEIGAFLRGGALLIVIGLGLWLGRLWRSELRREAP